MNEIKLREDAVPSDQGPSVHLSSDKPISAESDDALEFAAFADAVARSVTEMIPPDGLVISIEGKWGSGKSSALELAYKRIVIRQLASETKGSIENKEKEDWASLADQWSKRENKRKLHIVRFNPWIFSGQENLIRAFFSEIGAVIGHPVKGKVAKALAGFRDLLPAGGALVGAAAGGLVGNVPGTGVGSAAGRAAGEATKALFSKDASLEHAKHELALALEEAGKRVVVIIDDIDRLLPDEMRQLFSVVKSIGNLPNVVYILAFDRVIVEDILTRAAYLPDDSFLEKIIQVPLKLPKPRTRALHNLFFSRLNVIVGDSTLNSQGRWNQIFREAIAPYLDTPRDIIRIANMLQVIWPIVSGDVDIADLVTLTTLQLFEPIIYEAIVENVEELTGESPSGEDAKAQAERFPVDKAKKAKAAKDALGLLFPMLAKGWERTHFQENTNYITQRVHRRLCTREYYRNYFTFGVDPDRVRKADIEKLVSSDNPAPILKSLIERLGREPSRRGASRIAEFLEQIVETVANGPRLTEVLAKSLLDESDQLIERKDSIVEFWDTENIERLSSIIRFGVEATERGARWNLVRTIMEHPSGLTLRCEVAGRLAAQHGLFGGNAEPESERHIGRTEVDQIIDHCLGEIREAATSNALLDDPRPLRLIRFWRHGSSADELRTWFDAQLSVDAVVLRLAEILPGLRRVSSGWESREVLTFNAQLYSDFLDVGRMRQRLNEMAKRDGSRSKAAVLRDAFEAACQAHRNEF